MQDRYPDEMDPEPDYPEWDCEPWWLDELMTTPPQISEGEVERRGESDAFIVAWF